jgi:hypothetical protein
MKQIELINFNDTLVIEEPYKMTVSQAFKVLFLPTTATSEDLKKHYKKLATLTHPDKNGAQKESAERKFQTIAAAKAKVEAYLKNPNIEESSADDVKNSSPPYEVPMEADCPVFVFANLERDVEDFFQNDGIKKTFNWLYNARNTRKKLKDNDSSLDFQELLNALILNLKRLLYFYMKLVLNVFNVNLGSIHQEIADTVRAYKSAQDRQRDLTLCQRGVLDLLICFTIAGVMGAFLGLTIVMSGLAVIVACIQYMSVKITHGLQQLKRYRQHVDRKDKAEKETTSASPAYYQSARYALTCVFFVLFNLGSGLLLSPLLAMVLLKIVLQIVTYPLVLLVRIPLRDAITKIKGEPYIGENWNIQNLVKNIRKKIAQMKIAQNLKVINQQKIEIIKNITLINGRYKLAKQRGQQTRISLARFDTASDELLEATLCVNLNTSTNTIENFEACESAANDFLNLFERDRRTGTTLVETTQKNDLLRLTL